MSSEETVDKLGDGTEVGPLLEEEEMWMIQLSAKQNVDQCKQGSSLQILCHVMDILQNLLRPDVSSS
jgi:hypothetical protein